MHINIDLTKVFTKNLWGIFILCLLLSFDAVAAKFNAQKRYLYIQPGQSVFSIVKVLYPNQQEQWPQIIKKVVKVNPHAFVDGNPIKIKAGQRIELPAFKSKSTPVAQQKPAIKKVRSVGQVIKSRGKTFTISTKNKGKKIKKDLDVGSEIFVGDRIFTGVSGFIRLNMIDDAKIDLRCNSEMLIEDYQLLRGGNRSVIHLIKGSVKKITGSIGKMAEDIYEMHTPLATVGVRGTEYAIRVLQQHGCDGSLDVNSKGLFVKVNRGAIGVKSQKEKREVKQGEAAHLANAKSEIKSIKIQNGVFDAVQAEEKQTGLFGSVLWLLSLVPLILLIRKVRHYAGR